MWQLCQKCVGVGVSNRLGGWGYIQGHTFFNHHLVKIWIQQILKYFPTLTPVDHVNSIHQGLLSNKIWNSEMLFSFRVLPPVRLLLQNEETSCGSEQNHKNRSIHPASMEGKSASCLFCLAPRCGKPWEICFVLFFSLGLDGSQVSPENNVFPYCVWLNLNRGALLPASVFGKHPISWCSCSPNLLGLSWAFGLIHWGTWISGKFLPQALQHGY